jgi:hypothetical protein
MLLASGITAGLLTPVIVASGVLSGRDPGLRPAGASAPAQSGPSSEGSIAVSVTVAGLDDTDGDSIPDVVEIACGSDHLGAGSIPERIDGPFAGLDDDGDTEVDEPLPPGSESYDCDGDGYVGAAESHVYSYKAQTTGDQKVCREYDTSFPDPLQNSQPSLRWPADLKGSGASVNKVDLLDLASYVAPIRYLNTDVGTRPGDVRWDVVQSAIGADINLLDLANIVTVSPPMFGGNTLAFNGPPCPWPE